MFNKEFDIDEEIELERLKREQDKREFMTEIDHYSKQVAQLEERNYALECEI